jgi:DNA-binding LacI/PurR family transcriptional regulator
MQTNKPLYSKIIDYLKDQIKSNELKPYQQVPTEMELAERFKVSRITSKRALAELEKEGLIYRERGKGSFVKPQDVRESPSPRRESAMTEMSNVISLIIPKQEMDSRPFDYIVGVNNYLASRGYYLSVHTYHGKLDVARNLLQDLPSKGVGGIIYYPVNEGANLDILNILNIEGYPVVTVDKYLPVPVHYVVSDNFGGGRLAVSHLIENGHTRIGYLSVHSLDAATSVRERFFGYCQGMKEHGLAVDQNLVVLGFIHQIRESSNKLDVYKKIVETLLRQEVTAIQMMNDITAIQLTRACAEMGIKIPDQLSVIGFDDLEISGQLDVPLTTIAQDFVEIGRKAAEVLLGQLESKIQEQQRLVLPVKLVERSSSGPVRRS